MAPLSSLKTRQTLKSLGFSENEISVLTFLFHEKKSTCKEISQKTALSYSTCQYTLSNLVSRKLIKCLPGQEDSFQVCSQKEFLKWIHSQKKVNQEIYNKAENEVMDFFKHLEDDQWKPEVTYYEGREQMIELYEDILESMKDDENPKIYSWQDISKVKKIFGNYVDDYIKKRTESQVVSKAIMPDNKTNRGHNREQEYRQSKFLQDFNINGQVRVYSDKIAFITLHETKPIGFVFKGKIMADLFRAIFESCWNANS